MPIVCARTSAAVASRRLIPTELLQQGGLDGLAPEGAQRGHPDPNASPTIHVFQSA